jgi:hypothetical protein
MPRRPLDIEAALQTKFGFVRAFTHSSDHYWYELRLPGLPIILTKVSHSKEDIGPKLEGKIARQLRVRKPYFDGMIECHNSCEDYYRQVRESPFPPFDILF